MTEEEIAALEASRNKYKAKSRKLEASIKMLADWAHSFGYTSNRQESNAELIGRALRTERELWLKYRRNLSEQDDEVCQTLGKVLGFPWYMHDQVNFPGADESTGVCTGEWTADTMASLAADTIVNQQTLIGKLKGVIRVNALRAGHTHEEVDKMIESLENKE